jgi:hypothetical protein
MSQESEYEMQQDQQRYLAACHGMQTGVKWEMERALLQGKEPDSVSTSPKHLRVGVNSAMVSHAALVKLLIEKGILTEEEYVKSQADAMEAEVALYEGRANRILRQASMLGDNGPGPEIHFR